MVPQPKDLVVTASSHTVTTLRVNDQPAFEVINYDRLEPGFEVKIEPRPNAPRNRHERRRARKSKE